MSDKTLLAKVELSAPELMLLDGRCGDAVQAEVDRLKLRLRVAAESGLPEHLSKLVSDIVSEARGNGIIIRRPSRHRRCSYCGKSAGYYKFKSGYRRGEIDPKRPFYLHGFEFAVRFIRVEGSLSLGACEECCATTLDALKANLRGVRSEIPELLRPEGGAAFKRFDKRHCTKCGWLGHEGEMRKIPTLFGEGYYPGGCPSCDATNRLGQAVIEGAEGFEIVEVTS